MIEIRWSVPAIVAAALIGCNMAEDADLEDGGIAIEDAGHFGTIEPHAEKCEEWSAVPDVYCDPETGILWDVAPAAWLDHSMCSTGCSLLDFGGLSWRPPSRVDLLLRTRPEGPSGCLWDEDAFGSDCSRPEWSRGEVAEDGEMYAWARDFATGIELYQPTATIAGCRCCADL